MTHKLFLWALQDKTFSSLPPLYRKNKQNKNYKSFSFINLLFVKLNDFICIKVWWKIWQNDLDPSQRRQKKIETIIRVKLSFLTKEFWFWSHLKLPVYVDILWHVFGSCILLIKSCLPELDFNKAEINFAFNIHLYQIFHIPRLCSLVSLSERWWLWMVRFSAFCKFKNQTQTPNCINFRVIKIQLKECQHSKHKVQR